MPSTKDENRHQDSEEEWIANDASDDLEHIYARDIAKYNSDASQQSSEEEDSDIDMVDESHQGSGRGWTDDDEQEEYSSDDDFETWAQRQRAKKAGKRKPSRQQESSSDDESSSYDNEQHYDNSEKNDHSNAIATTLTFKQKKRKKKNTKKKTNRSRSQKIRCRRRFQNLQPLPMPTSTEKLNILANITTADFTSAGHYEGLEAWSDAEVCLCKFIQCALWDCNFRYTLLPHQFVAVVSVAGINMTALLRQMAQLNDEECKRLVDVGKKGLKFRSFLCIHNMTFVETRGFLLADVMGLGKTVSSIAGAILRNYIMKLKCKAECEQKRAAAASIHLGDSDDNCDKKSSSSAKEKDSAKKKRVLKMEKHQSKKIYAKLPTLIAGPNDAVLDQWEETLILSGIQPSKIKPYRFNDNDVLVHVDHFVLLTRYAMMSEMRNLIETGESNLFQDFPKQLLKCMRNIYLSSKGKAKIQFRKKGETGAACFRRTVLQFMDKLSKKPFFRTFIIDEAHFLKNLEAYWGMLATCIGAVTDKFYRTVPVTGTPFNNANQDMATLMTFIDPALESAQVCWWDDATKHTNARTVIQNVEDWRKNYVVRREKTVLAAHLTKKFVDYTEIGCYKTELGTYQYYDDVFRKVLKQFTQLNERSQNLLVQRRRMESFSIMMACMMCMRMALIHPIIPRGREVTVQFSPSRRNSAVVRAAINNDLKEECVICERYPSQRDLSEEAMKEMANNEPRGIHNANGDEECIDDANFDGSKGKKKKRYNISSKLVEVPSSICPGAKSGYKHYIHECCLKEYMKDECPRCADLRCRVKHSNDSTGQLSTMYCKDISAVPGVNGFQTTSKIEKVIEWAKNIPEGEKGILYSFFKGTLDLFEGILEDLGCKCSRFDGDMDPLDRSRELETFKKSKSCRMLLATVQSSGTGLNIVEANHVAFTDRWFNPCVHSQAEDRCHRYKQTRDVHVKYFDNSATVDQVMKIINEKKTVNGSILLADGMSIGALSGGLSFQELSGTIGLLMSEMNFFRTSLFNMHPSRRLGILTDEQIVDMLENPRSLRKNEEKKECESGKKGGRLTSSSLEDQEVQPSFAVNSSTSDLCEADSNNADSNDDDNSLESDGTIEILDEYVINDISSESSPSNIISSNEGTRSTNLEISITDMDSSLLSDGDDLPSPGPFYQDECTQKQADSIKDPTTSAITPTSSSSSSSTDCLLNNVLNDKGRILKDISLNAKTGPDMGIEKKIVKDDLGSTRPTIAAKADADEQVSDNDDDDEILKPSPFSQAI